MRARWVARGLPRLLCLSLGMVLLGSMPAAAITWNAARPIHPSTQPMAVDADLHGPDTAIVWLDEAGPDEGLLGLAAFRGGGTGEIYRYTVEDGVARAAVATCGGAAWMAWFRPLGDGGGELELARIDIGGNGIERVTIRSGALRVGAIDVDCGAGRIWVAWTERTTSWHAFMRSVRIADLARSGTRDLGAADRWSISMAATDGRATVAWATGVGLRLKPFTIGRAPTRAVTAGTTRSLIAGGQAPMLAMDGRRMVLGYTRNNDAWVRTSTDAGATFSGARKLLENGGEEDGGETPAWFESLAVDGPRIVATMAAQWPPVPVFTRSHSANGGATWTVEALDIHARLAGFLDTPDGPRIGEVKLRTGWWDEPMDWRITFRRQS